MLIELEDKIIDSYFELCQIEITGRCNMCCEHCRAWKDTKVDMSMELFEKALKFADPSRDFRVTLSGGEPFIHPNLVQMLQMLKDYNIENVIITTNGSLVTLPILQKIKDIAIKNLVIQVSVDSYIDKEHDQFRNFKNAFKLAMKCFDYLKELKIQSSLKCTFTPEKIIYMEELLKLAIDKGAIRFAGGSVIPTGKGKENKVLLMTAKEKKTFIQKVFELKRKYEKIIDVASGDPLKFALADCPFDSGCVSDEFNNDGFFGGCTAGIGVCNITADGFVTPCSVFLKNIVDLNKNSVEEAIKIYANSEIIKNLCAKKFSGKCGSCKLKNLCGGCRAIAYGQTGDYLASDTTCFYNETKGIK